jgi:hypothetical protein
VTTRVVVGRVLLATDQQLRVEELSVVTSADLIDRAGVQVDEDGSGDVFARAGLREDGVELAAVVEGLGIRVGTAILLETVLEEVAADGRLESRIYNIWTDTKDDVQLPCTVPELGSGLADMEVKDLLGGWSASIYTS